MPDSFVQVPPNSTGLKLRTRARTVGANDVQEQYVIPAKEEVVSYRGRSSSFRIPGRAGTTGQRLFGLFNALGSPVIAQVGVVRVDLYQTVVKAVTVPPPIIRVSRLATTAPAGGNVGTKVALDSALASNASVTVSQDASADGTSSTVALSFTPVANSVLGQEFAPRFVTAAGYEMADRMAFMDEAGLYLRAGEGIGVHLDYTLATQNPITDMWIVSVEWDEFTLP